MGKGAVEAAAQLKAASNASGTSNLKPQTVCGRMIKSAAQLDYKEGFAFGKVASYQKAYNKAYDRGLYSV